jgi:hypothetical protein
VPDAKAFNRQTVHVTPRFCWWEDAMQRLFIFAMALWLAGFGTALAQTSSRATSQAQVGQPTQQAGVAPTTIAPLPPATTAGATQNQSAATQPGLPASSASAASATDPLSVPTSTTSGTATAGAMSAPAFVNPQRAVQLSGEGTNTSTQAPTASAASGGAGVGTSSNAACSTAIPTTTGASGGGGLFGAGSVGGC